MIQNYWNALSLRMRIIFAVCGWVFIFILIHGTYTYRVNHQRAFAQSVAIRIGIPTIRVSAKSDILILEGSATQEQSEYAEKIAQYYIMKYGPRSVNPPTEIRNSIQLKAPLNPRLSKQAFNRAPLQRSQLAHGTVKAHANLKTAAPNRLTIAKRRTDVQRVSAVGRTAVTERLTRNERLAVAQPFRRRFKYSEVVSSKRYLAAAQRPSQSRTR
jgi:hypothetical protein